MQDDVIVFPLLYYWSKDLCHLFLYHSDFKMYLNCKHRLTLILTIFFHHGNKCLSMFAKGAEYQNIIAAFVETLDEIQASLQDLPPLLHQNCNFYKYGCSAKVVVSHCLFFPTLQFWFLRKKEGII